ncbi:MAG: hypothetical protein MR852_06370 [Treponema sp.]|nr:hypothetical protein [Treponema sp.]
MYTNRIVALVVAVLIVLDMIWFVIRGKKNGFRDPTTITKGIIVRKIVIYAMSLGLLVVACFREFGLVGNIGFSGCALLAVEITNRYFLSKTNEYDEEPSQEQ